MSSTSKTDQRSPEYLCPGCGKPTELRTQAGTRRNKYFPFCSQRCKLVDLGAWLDAEYRIASREQEEEVEFTDL